MAGPFSNGVAWGSNGGGSLFEEIGNIMRDYGLPPLKRRYTTSIIRGSGYNIYTQLGYELATTTSVRYMYTILVYTT